MDTTLWPLRGLWFFVARPRLWARPMAAMLITGVVLLIVIVSVAWALWPLPDQTWYWTAFGIGKALGLGAGVGLLCWVVLSPLLMGVALDSLANAAQRELGLPAISDSALRSLWASLRVLLNTLPLRLGWSAAALIGAFVGPVGLIVSAYGMARIAAIDAADINLGVRGLGGLARLHAIQAHRDELIAGAFVGAMMYLVLTLTVVGWLVWLPAMVCGAALRTATWRESHPATVALSVA